MREEKRKESDWDERCAVFQGKAFLYRISKRMPNMRPIGARKVNSNMHLSLKGNRIVQSWSVQASTADNTASNCKKCRKDIQRTHRTLLRSMLWRTSEGGMCLWECKSTDPYCYVPLSLSVKLEDKEIRSGPTGQVIAGSWTVRYCRWPSCLPAHSDGAPTGKRVDRAHKHLCPSVFVRILLSEENLGEARRQKKKKKAKVEER